MRLLPAVLLLALAIPTPARADDGLSITKKQFQLYRDYQDALKDSRVQKMKAKDRLPAIAKNFHVKAKDLQDAVSLGDTEGPRVEPAVLAGIKASFKGSPVESQLGDIRVDASAGHIVAYVQWFNSDRSKLDQEACWIAARAVKGSEMVGTVDLYANDAAAKDKKVYTSLIGADRAVNIREADIPDFAQTRYVRLFEKRQITASQP